MIWDELGTPTVKEETQQDEVTLEASPIDLPIDDVEFIQRTDNWINESTKYFKDDLKLDQRRKTNRDFYKGKQVDEAQLDNFQIAYIDNVIYRNLEHRIALAAGRMPDIVCGPADDSQQAKDKAKKAEKFVDKKVKSDTNHRLIKDGLRNQSLDLYAVIKARWDANNGENGDFTFDLVKPGQIVFDHTATIPHDGFTADNMGFICEWVEEPLSVVGAKFPSKKEELYAEAGRQGKKGPAKIKYKEIHFTWYDESGKQYEGTGWAYNKIVLGKQKTPNWDWEGYEKAVQGQLGEYGVEKVFRNHFDRPRKPYIFITSANLGEGPVDDTTVVEQTLPIQRTINKRGRQITEIADQAVPRLVFAGKYIDKEEAARISQDPAERIWLQNATKASDAMMTFQANPPSPILFQDLIGNRNQADSMFATSSTTRGETVPQESGISKQISREGNLTIADDTSQITVERIVYEMANWAVQFMKLRYKEEHYIRDMGKDGEAIYLDMKQDQIDDGISVQVKANSVDKQTRRAEALELANAKSIDPLTLFEDLDVADPKTRTTRLVAWLQGEMDGFARYQQVIGVDANEPEQGVEPQANAQQDIQTLIQGGQVQPQGIDEQYIQGFMQFVQGGEFEQLPPDAQQRIIQYVGTLRDQANQQPEQQPEQPLTPQMAGSTIEANANPA